MRRASLPSRPKATSRIRPWRNRYWPRSTARGSRTGSISSLRLSECRSILDFVGVLSGENGQTRDVECLAEHGGILDECPFFSTEPVEASPDDGLEGFRDDQLGQVADDPIIPSFTSELPLSEQASQQLDCIEGDACGALHDGLGRRLGDSRYGAMRPM